LVAPHFPLCYYLSMVNEAERKLVEEAGAHAPLNLHPEVENVGIETWHEDVEHEIISAALEGTGAKLEKDAVPPSSVTGALDHTQFEKLGVDDPVRWNAVGKLLKIKKGLKNAA